MTQLATAHFASETATAKSTLRIGSGALAARFLAIREELTTAELPRKYGIHPT